MKYKGWTITRFMWHNKEHFSAEQYGVSMNTNSLDGVKKMIDYKIYEREQHIKLYQESQALRA